MEYKGLILKEGIKIQIFNLKEGITNGKKWQFFFYHSQKKDQTSGEYVSLQKFTVFINNPQEGLRDGDYVKIKSIVSIQPTIFEKDGKVNRTIILNIEIEGIGAKSQAQKDADEIFGSNGFVDDFDYQF